MLQCTYELMSMLLHCGTTATSGHYTAVVRASDQWFTCDDTQVSYPAELLAALMVTLSPCNCQVFVIVSSRN